MTVRDHKLEGARKLASSHVAFDESVDEVFLSESASDEDESEPIRLLEIVDGTIERGVGPVGFIEVSPQEFRQLKSEPFVSFRSERWTVGPRVAAR